jgi:hypothetical protein
MAFHDHQAIFFQECTVLAALGAILINRSNAENKKGAGMVWPTPFCLQ